MASTLVNNNPTAFTKELRTRAIEKLRSFDRGDVRAIALLHTKQGKVFKLEVGRCYRLVSHDRSDWVLMTHETYNKLMKK